MNALHTMRADILALDANDEPVMVVEVKAIRHIEQEAQDTVAASLRDVGFAVRYVMLVDLEWIRLFAWAGAQLTEPVFQAPTAQVLSHYDEEFARKKVFDYYLTKLAQAWLDDLAYQWKSPMPPCSNDLAQIGLVELLRSGTTLANVDLHAQAFVAA